MKSIFLLWNLIIGFATLKGGDGGGGGSSATEDDFNSDFDDDFSPTAGGQSVGMEENNESDTTTEEFTNDVTGQAGTVSYDEEGNYSVDYDDGSGHGYGMAGFDDGYEYGSDTNSSFLTEFNSIGLVKSAYASTNQAVGDYTTGVTNTYDVGLLGFVSINSYGYTQEMGLTGMVSLRDNFHSQISIGSVSIDTSLLGTVSMNGTDIGYLGTLGYNLAGVKTGQVAAILAYGVEFYLGLGVAKTGLSLLGVGLKAPGMLAAVAGLKSMYSSFTAINAIYGNFTSLAVGNASSDFSLNGEGPVSVYQIKSIINADNEAIAAKRLIDSYSSDIYTGEIFDKMAGGILYDIKAAGNNYFDASTVNNPNVSVGGKFEITDFARRVNIPNAKHAFPKSAGDVGWNVLKI